MQSREIEKALLGDRTGKSVLRDGRARKTCAGGHVVWGGGSPGVLREGEKIGGGSLAFV